MLFNSFPFAAFFAAVYVAFVVSPRGHGTKVLLVASLLFYALWVPSYLAVLAGMLAVSYLFVQLMVKSARPKLWLAANVVFVLSVLSVFKYAAFALELLDPLFTGLLHMRVHAPYWVLPLGISFYSFELISLAVDIEQGRLECPSFPRYALFVTFFPHLIAGPIMRGEELLPQLERGGERTRERSRRGVWLFATGLAKKTILSDFLLLPFVTEVFDVPGAANGPVHLVAAYSFAFQIYFDFSGYSDMARGLALLLGFELPMNFEEPYLSRDPSEFWTRWHMTLSRWLRDYLYIPLGGNRHGPARTVIALMLTMLLGGLWHGAGLNFVLWGGIHGLLLVLHRLADGRRTPRDAPLVARDVVRIAVLFNVVCLAWVPFRAKTFADTGAFYEGLARGQWLRGWPLLPTAVAAFCMALHVAERAIRQRLPFFHERLARAPWGPAFEGGFFGLVVVAALVASGAGVEFIYFQF
jgi:alginate O-acetyltransferase complex protein AlgI